ncbi:MAG: Rieske 2Fe-2S domain-containing protein, partial [Phycisphaerales bacterium]
ILSRGVRFDGVAQFPFQPLGLVALLILFAMAATSHDFWLRNLSPQVWKALHLGVYLAFALIVAHVALGALQVVVWPGFAWITVAAVVWVAGLHLAAGVKEWRADRRARALASDGWVRACEVDEVELGAAKSVLVGPRRGGGGGGGGGGGPRRRGAGFRHARGFSAISGVCAHQGGPLGEGRIVDGCVTCPWHGYQYRAEDGQSPPPFTERVPTYELRIEGRMVFVNPQAKAPGTPIPPCAPRDGEGGSP